jgi:pyruvate dehydrogenase E2 component (dihydrolipoamide acetyltransferase)
MSDENGTIQAITMPKWGLAIEEGMVTAWLVDEGDALAADADLVEIETTKITNVWEKPVAGTLARRVAAEGETVPVGALLGLVAPRSVPDTDLDAYVDRFNAQFEVSAAAAEAAAPEPQMVEAGSHAINFLRMGPAGAPSVILIHGFGGDLNGWMFNQRALADGRDVLALDQPGHGRSGKEIGAIGVNALAMLADTLNSVLQTLKIERAHLVGHSMGGGAALALAIDHPDRVIGLTLLAPAGLGADINMAFIDGFIAANRRRAVRPVLEQLVADPSLVGREIINEVLKYKRLDGVEEALRGLAGALFPGGRQQTLDTTALAAIRAPITAIWGADHRIVPSAHADALPAGARVHRLPGIGHLPHMEASTRVNEMIAAAVASS